MNAASFKTILAEAGTDALWRTNPVLCIDRLLVRWHELDVSGAVGPGGLHNLLASLFQESIRLPAEALERWAADGHIPPEIPLSVTAQDPEPRIIGLATDSKANTGYV